MTVKIDRELCIRCTGCVAVCPVGALDYQGNRIVVDPKKCTDCNICAKFCPMHALSVPGKPIKD